MGRSCKKGFDMTIDEIVEYTEYQTEQLNNYLTNRIIERIMAVYAEKGVQMIPATLRDIVKILSTGKTLKEIEKDIEKKLPGMEKEIRKAFVYAGNEIEREQDGFLKNIIEDSAVTYHAVRTGAYVTPDKLYLTETEKGLLESACRRTQGTFRNYTATTAKTTQKALIDAMDKAYNKVVHGVSLHTATAEAIEEYAKIGTMVDFGSGVKQRLETVVTRAVRTGVAQASGDITLARCNELDVDQVLVTSHIGARYTDKHEPANHMWWQGKVYDWDKTGQKKATDSVGTELHEVAKQIQHDPNESAGDFIKITGYGTGEGLCGWNCRHTFTPFFKGININNQKQFDDDENKKRYDLEQKQRAMERKIRDLKREYEGLNHAYKIAPDGPLKDTLKDKKQIAHKKYIDAVRNYNDWSKQNGLRPKQERLKIANQNV